LKTITQEELIHFFETYVQNPKMRRKISIQIFGNKYEIPQQSEAELDRQNIVLIKDLDSFKKNMPLFPFLA
jgi:secreted Zn-dependent insulinase-like peptidase